MERPLGFKVPKFEAEVMVAIKGMKGHTAWNKGARRPLAERFWSKVDKTAGLTGCWIWTGCTQVDGYGQIWVEDGMRPAHRVAFELVEGIIPVGLEVLHRCDNPICVNPFHLFTGTQSDNIRDCVAKGRHASQIRE